MRAGVRSCPDGHDGNQAMALCVVNAAVKADENENLRPVKTSPRKRIDGVVAAVTAISQLMVLPEPIHFRVAAAGLVRRRQT